MKPIKPRIKTKINTQWCLFHFSEEGHLIPSSYFANEKFKTFLEAKLKIDDFFKGKEAICTFIIVPVVDINYEKFY